MTPSRSTHQREKMDPTHSAQTSNARRCILTLLVETSPHPLTEHASQDPLTYQSTISLKVGRLPGFPTQHTRGTFFRSNGASAGIAGRLSLKTTLVWILITFSPCQGISGYHIPDDYPKAVHVACVGYFCLGKNVKMAGMDETGQKGKANLSIATVVFQLYWLWHATKL